jgi:hypothetical protein
LLHENNTAMAISACSLKIRFIEVYFA